MHSQAYTFTMHVILKCMLSVLGKLRLLYLYSSAPASTTIIVKIIDLDVEQPTQQSKKHTKPSAMWLHLLQKDKEILLSPTGWVTDSIVNAAQKLLREQFPHLPGLQDVSLGHTKRSILCLVNSCKLYTDPRIIGCRYQP